MTVKHIDMYGFHLGRGPAISGHNEQLWPPTPNFFSHNRTMAREARSLTHILLQKCILFEDQNATVSFLMTIMYAWCCVNLVIDTHRDITCTHERVWAALGLLSNI